VSIYAGYNSLQTALETNREEGFKEIVNHEIEDIKKGYHAEESITDKVNELYNHVLSQRNQL
jgi:hypothetical protein